MEMHFLLLAMVIYLLLTIRNISGNHTIFGFCVEFSEIHQGKTQLSLTELLIVKTSIALTRQHQCQLRNF